MKNKKLFFLAVFILNILFVQAQNRTISGEVIDNEGNPIIGASIWVKGTQSGASTDLNGKYSIANINPKSTLVVSYVGFQTQEISTDGNTSKIELQPSENRLDDVIVVAYGTVAKAGYTGSVSSVGKEEISQAQVSSVSRLLQGAASGVQAISPSGQPGSDASVFIRGIGSINASKNPLYIVDGAPFDGSLNSINPGDIETINVLKDAASTALYGSRAGNGLIIITTKQGSRDNKAKIEASLRYGTSSRAVNEYDRVSTNDYFKLYWESLRNHQLYVQQLTPENAAQYATNNLVSTLGINPYGTGIPNPIGTDGNLVSGATPLWDDDWSKNYTQDANRTEAQVSVAGGGKASTYFFSLGYLNDQGIALASDFKRYAARLNMNTDLRPWLHLTTGIALTHSVQNAPQSEDSNLANTLNFARMMPNFYPLWERDRATGEFILDANNNRIFDYGDYRPSGANPRYNHLGTSPLDFNRVMKDMASIRTALEIDIYKGLSYKGSVNIDYTNQNDHNYYNPEFGSESYNENPGSVSKYNYRTTGFTGNNILTYKTVIDKVHNLRVFAGQEYYEYNRAYIYGSRSGFPVLGLEEPAAASELGSFTGKSDQYKLLSFFGNAEYNYNYKYYASASVRTDGSSRFSPDSRWGTFWSVGASWRINEENFLKNVTQVTKLSLRASYGGQGNDNLSSYYASQGLFAINNNLGESGFVTSVIENKNLKWETNLNLNIGLDFGFYQNRVSGSVEYFSRRSKDLLFEVPQPLSIGYSGYQSNVGAMENKGIEVQLNGSIIRNRDFTWDVSVNLTHYNNKITKLPQEQIISGTKLLKPGGSVFDFFLAEWAGVDPATGLAQWYKTDTNGNRVKTFVYDEANTKDSKIVAGSSLPNLSGGFSTALTYKGFEFSALFAYTLGGKIYNQDNLGILHNGSIAGRAMSVEMLNRWTPENTNTDVPRLQALSNTYAWTSQSTRFLVDADYLRLRNITFGYNIPPAILKKASINNLKLFIQGENLLTVFAEQGLDPEQTVDGTTYYRYPAMKTLSVGANISF